MKIDTNMNDTKNERKDTTIKTIVIVSSTDCVFVSGNTNNDIKNNNNDITDTRFIINNLLLMIILL
jgi:hypothetical protein